MQTYQNIEVLLADGNSDDGSINILEHYSAKYGWEIYSRKDKSQADAINRGLQLATGHIQCWLNSDDFFLSNNALEKVVELFQEFPTVDIISLGGYYTDAIGRWLRPVKLQINPLFRQTDCSYGGLGFLQPATFWKSSVFHEIGLSTDLRYTFDSYFFIQASQKFSMLINQDMYISGYRWHGENLSSGIKADRINDIAQLNALLFGFKFRYFYIKIVKVIIQFIDLSTPTFVAFRLKTLVYVFSNFLSLISFYRIPRI